MKKTLDNYLLVGNFRLMQDRKSEILDLALTLIQYRSFSAFSYRDLSERLGISKAAIHHHFPSKESLGVAAAERYHEQVKTMLMRSANQSDDPWKQFEGYLMLVDGIMETEDRICAAGSVQADFKDVPASIRDEMAALIRFVISWIAGIIETGREQGRMDFPGESIDQAVYIFTAVQGALQIGRAQGKDQFDRVIRQIRSNLKPRE